MTIDSQATRMPRAILRAVFDSNIYVAAYLSKNPRSPNKELIRRWRNREITLLISDAILEEVIEKFNERGIDQKLTAALVAFLLTDAEFTDTPDTDIPTAISGDPDDNQVLACAMTGNADYLVTYDPHFDILGGEHQGIRIVDALHFLYIIRGDTKPEG